MRTSILPVCLVLAAMTPAHAQSNASLLPDGATDVRMGAVLGTAPSAPGSARRSAFLVPQFSAEWSNGVFVEGLAVGKQMSSDPMLGYGPVLAVNLGAQRADGSSVIRPVTGVFVQYQPLRELALHAQVSIPLLRDTGGALFNFRASTQFVPAAHHWLEFGTGFNAADRRYQQTDFRTAQFQPSGGLRDVFADVQWGWQVSRKITLTASVRAARLQGDAAASPRTRQRTGVANALGFSYSY